MPEVRDAEDPAGGRESSKAYYESATWKVLRDSLGRDHTVVFPCQSHTFYIAQVLMQ